MSPKSRWLLLGLSTPLVILAAVGGLLGAPAAPQKGFEHLRVFDDVVSLVTGAYVEEVNVDKVMEGAMRGLAETLDPSSAYLNTDETLLAQNNTPLGDGDPGLVITRQFYLRVLGVKDGSPAARAGLRSGDFVRAIDGTPTRDMSAFTGARMLRGAVGSSVKLVIIRGNAAEPHDLTLTREKMADASIVSSEINSLDKIGYLRIKTFAATGTGGVADAMRQQVEKMQKDGAKGVVIDIRGIADGSYDEAIKAAQIFIASGTIATRAGRDNANKEVIPAAGGNVVTLPVVVLQSFGTAGPAEVFASAMQSNKRAELVGERTAGLAAEQHLVKLPHNFGLWMTYRRYFTNAGVAMLEKGLAPDVPAEEPNVEYGEAAPAGDDMRAKAIERVKAAKAS